MLYWFIIVPLYIPVWYEAPGSCEPTVWHGPPMAQEREYRL